MTEHESLMAEMIAILKQASVERLRMVYIVAKEICPTSVTGEGVTASPQGEGLGTDCHTP